MCINDAPTGLTKAFSCIIINDVILQWNHPLADYKWYDIIMNCDIKLKGVHYHKRYPILFGRAWSWFDTAWELRWSRGLTQ